MDIIHQFPIVNFMKKIKIKKIENVNEAVLNLLLLADPSKELVEKYLKKGECFAASAEDRIVGVYLLLNSKNGISEIANISVDQKMQNRGIGKLLIKDAIQRAEKSGMKKITVGTGNSSIGQLAFYQKCGFKISGIKKDFFLKNYAKPIFEDGIQCNDMIMLEIILK